MLEIHDHDLPVYDAEEAAALEHADCCDDWSNDAQTITQGQVVPFMRRVLELTGWIGGGCAEVRFDVADDEVASGVHHAGPDGEYLRFHPRLLKTWIILHELAHWLRPRDGHGPQFCGVLIGLVRAGIDEDAARILQEQYAAFDVEVDLSWSGPQAAGA